MRQLVNGGKIMTVVKANAYGHGAVQVARAALRGGASWLGVYTVQEGETLRRHGVQAPILVFGPFQRSEAKVIVQNKLTPTITNVEAGSWLQDSSDGQRMPFHLKVDSGLSRAGVLPCEVADLLEKLSALPALVAEGIYTHFARADELDQSYTQSQLAIFLQLIQCLGDAGRSFEVRHAANSAATLGLPESHLDMVRCGISTYGYFPSSFVPKKVRLQPALSWMSSITRVHSITSGTGVGYGHEFRAERTSTIALVPIGYGDGLSRGLGHGRGSVIVRGAPAPIIGRVSMDQITIDVTDIGGVKSGDAVIIIGANDRAVQSAEDVAAAAGTISYDVLTAILPRVPRLYSELGTLKNLPSCGE
ncbi:MAG: alanine racemase [Chloroflexota bacterium]